MQGALEDQETQRRLKENWRQQEEIKRQQERQQEEIKRQQEEITRKQVNQIIAVSRISTEAGEADLTEKLSINDLYEYDVVTITDKSTGAMDVVSLQNVLSERGKLGGRLVNSFTNEIGVNSSSISYAGYTSGTNATIDQTILIFERCIRRASLSSDDE